MSFAKLELLNLPSSMKTIYFVRHGESESNAKDISSGSGNDIPLTAKGRQQAKQAGIELKDKRIQLIVSSPMTRTVDTATIIAKELGYDPQKIVRNPLFKERDLGIYEGQHRDRLYGDIAKVESEDRLHSRLKEALSWLSKQKEDRIVVVSHGGARRAVRVINENLPISHMYKIEAAGNGEIYEFSL
jgi:broad specificity phosphatase PhoE